MRNAIATTILLVVITFISRASAQSCPAGDNMHGSCVQRCNSTNCNMKCENIAKTCMQACLDPGSCPVSNCSSSGSCVQMCMKECGSLTCKAENCTQSCQGNCKTISCDSKRCSQICEKGGCNMECSSKAESCNQVCSKDCTFKCNAKDCFSMCEGGGCKHVGAPKNKTSCDGLEDGTCLQIGCPWSNCHMDCSKSRVSQLECAQTCYPPTVPCPRLMTCDTPTCGQTCFGDCESATCKSSDQCVQECGGKCRLAHCTSKICSQFCIDDACALECSEGTELCNQACNGTACGSLVSKAKTAEIQLCQGNCDSMQCNSPNCTQTCTGKCPKMLCNGDVCKQECSGESCEMHCPKSVKTCTQRCKKGSCKFACKAKNCKRDCAEGAKCSDVKSKSRANRLDQSFLAMGVLVVIGWVLNK